MKVYLSEDNEKVKDKLLDFDLCEQIEESDSVFIVPNGGMESFLCLLKGLDLGKTTYVCNENYCYKKLVDRLNEMITKGTISIKNDQSMVVENSIDSLIERMEEKKNEQLNDGKISQLL